MLLEVRKREQCFLWLELLCEMGSSLLRWARPWKGIISFILDPLKLVLFCDIQVQVVIKLDVQDELREVVWVGSINMY